MNSPFNLFFEIVMLAVAWIITQIVSEYVLHSTDVMYMVIVFVVAYLAIFAIVYWVRYFISRKR